MKSAHVSFRDKIRRVILGSIAAGAIAGCTPPPCLFSEGNSTTLEVTVKSDLTSVNECRQLCQQAFRDAKFHGQILIEASTAQVIYSNDCEGPSNQDFQERKAGEKVVCSYGITDKCENVGIGRIPVGVEMPDVQQTSNNLLGEWFAQMAFFEEAAVISFDYLANELRFFGAPEEMIQVALDAIEEEKEHAEMAKTLMKGFGGKEKAVVVEKFQERSFFDFVLDNAKEGCIRETFGTVVASWQSVHAKEQAIRAVLERVAFDESRHAMLSWQIHDWAMPQLSIIEQEEIRRQQELMKQEMKASLEQELPEAVHTMLGLPSQQEAQHLFRALEKELWT